MRKKNVNRFLTQKPTASTIATISNNISVNDKTHEFIVKKSETPNHLDVSCIGIIIFYYNNNEKLFFYITH